MNTPQQSIARQIADLIARSRTAADAARRPQEEPGRQAGADAVDTAGVAVLGYN